MNTELVSGCYRPVIWIRWVAHVGWFSAGTLVLLACSAGRVEDRPEHPSVVFPAHFAEGENEEHEAEKPQNAPATTSAQATPGLPPSTPPDPAPLQLAEQWHLTLQYDRGTIIVAKRELVTHDPPVVTARKLGRYALELWIGKELIERVRFDFPMLAADPAPSGPVRPLNEPPRFAPGALVEQQVLLPNSARATRLVLVDRATGKVMPLPWPLAPRPEASPEPPASPAEEGKPSRSEPRTIRLDNNLAPRPEEPTKPSSEM